MSKKRGMARDRVSTPVMRPYAAPSARSTHAGPTPSQVTIEAVEVCQVIQSVDSAVTLIAGKATLVRVYLDQAALAGSVKLRGELAVRTSANGPVTYVPAIGDLMLDPQDTTVLPDKRKQIAASLNFRLPPNTTMAGTLFVQVNRLSEAGGSDVKTIGMTKTEVEFVSAPPLRIRCVGLRYRDAAGKTHAPGSVHFAYLRSFLERAYPVPSVDWSQIVVDADFMAPFDADTVIQANMQIAAIRSSEVNSGTDPRTHYLGLVDDAAGRNFMRGRAMGIPASPQPDTVASSPCGVPNGFAGDTDLSYADWYGAHELGHTFGRYHPGFPVGDQDASDPAFPFQNGQLSDADQKYVGYDLGDPTLGIPMQALSGTDHHDLMTYATRQWICAHTFEAIRVRLIQEDQNFAPAIA